MVSLRAFSVHVVSCVLCCCLGELQIAHAFYGAQQNDASSISTKPWPLLSSDMTQPAKSPATTAQKGIVKQKDASKNAVVNLESNQIQDEQRAIEAISGSRVPGTIEHLLLRPTDQTPSHMSIALLYPSFGRADVDSDIRQWITELADTFERSFDYTLLSLETAAQPEALNDPIELQADYTVSRPSSKAVSITFQVWNHVGGPHPNLDVITLNYSLINGQRLSLADIFAKPTIALTLLSERARAILQERYGTGRTHMLKHGTEPLLENFSSLTLTPEGVSVHFQPYQVAGWEMGAQTVDISLEELAKAQPCLVYWGR